MGLFRERHRDFGRTLRRLRKVPGALRKVDRESFMSLLTYFKVIDVCCYKPILAIDTKCGQKKRKTSRKERFCSKVFKDLVGTNLKIILTIKIIT